MVVARDLVAIEWGTLVLLGLLDVDGVAPVFEGLLGGVLGLGLLLGEGPGVGGHGEGLFVGEVVVVALEAVDVGGGDVEVGLFPSHNCWLFK